MENFKLTPKDVDDWIPKVGYGIIYVITFDNGKVYVGQTVNTAYSRYIQHYYDTRLDLPSFRALHAHAHTLKIIATVRREELNDYEIRFIKAYDSHNRDKGYNLTDGGEGCPNEPHCTQIRCIETGVVYLSLTDACKDTGATLGKIDCCARGLMDTTGGYHWEYPGEEVVREFNIFARAVSRYINWETYKVEHKDELSERGRALSRKNVGRIVSGETRQKMSESNKKSHPKKNPDAPPKVRKYNEDGTLNEEYRQKVSEASKRARVEHPENFFHDPMSEEHKKKISEANKGKKKPPMTEEQRAKLSEAGKGRKMSEETKQKMRDARKRYLSEHPEEKNRLGDSRRGTHMSEEQRANISESERRTKAKA